jgi:hypothetical protein
MRHVVAGFTTRPTKGVKHARSYRRPAFPLRRASAPGGAVKRTLPALAAALLFASPAHAEPTHMPRVTDAVEVPVYRDAELPYAGLACYWCDPAWIVVDEVTAVRLRFRPGMPFGLYRARNQGLAVFTLAHELGHVRLETADEATADRYARSSFRFVARSLGATRTQIRRMLRANDHFRYMKE